LEPPLNPRSRLVQDFSAAIAAKISEHLAHQKNYS
jgi:hypothetical protein